MTTELHSIDELLTVMVERSASDLHLTVGSPAVIRVNGRLERLADHDTLQPEEIRTLVYRILSTEQQKTLETRRQIDFSHSIPGLARFRVNTYFQRGALGAAFRLIPDEIKTLEQLGLPAAAHRARRQAARPRARHRADRLGQVDDARVAAPPHQPHAARAHPHDRGPDRVPAHARQLHRQPARDRPGRDDVRRGPPRRAPPGPRRDPRRRDARPGDGRHRAHRRRDRPPRVRDAAHPERADHDRPRHRRLPGRAAGPGARAARLDAPGRRHADPRPDRGRARPEGRARGPHPRRRGPQPDPPGEGRADLLGDADEHLARDADDGAVPRRPRAAPRDHARGRLLALVAARPAARPARALRLDEPRLRRLPTAPPPRPRPHPRTAYGSPRRCKQTHGPEEGDQAVGPRPAAEEEDAGRRRASPAARRASGSGSRRSSASRSAPPRSRPRAWSTTAARRSWCSSRAFRSSPASSSPARCGTSPRSRRRSPSFFRTHKLPRRGVRLGIATNRIGVRSFELEGIEDERQLANAIRFRAHEELSIPLDEAVLDYHVVSESVDETGAALAPRRPRRRVPGLDRPLRRGLQARPGSRSPSSTWRLSPCCAPSLRATARDEQAAVVAVTIGHDRTTLAISDGAVCDFTRVLEWGGANLEDAIARELGVTADEAAQLQARARPRRRRVGRRRSRVSVAHAPRSPASCRRSHASWSPRCASTRASPARSRSRRCWSPAARRSFRGLAEELERLTRVRVRRADPLAGVQIADAVGARDDLASLAVAIGLGIEG